MILQQAVTLLCLCAIGLASPSWVAFPGQKLRISIDASVIPNDVSEETLHLLEQVLAEVQIEARTEENSADLKKALRCRDRSSTDLSSFISFTRNDRCQRHCDARE